MNAVGALAVSLDDAPRALEDRENHPTRLVLSIGQSTMSPSSIPPLLLFSSHPHRVAAVVSPISYGMDFAIWFFSRYHGLWGGKGSMIQVFLLLLLSCHLLMGVVGLFVVKYHNSANIICGLLGTNSFMDTVLPGQALLFQQFHSLSDRVYGTVCSTITTTVFFKPTEYCFEYSFRGGRRKVVTDGRSLHCRRDTQKKQKRLPTTNQYYWFCSPSKLGNTISANHCRMKKSQSPPTSPNPEPQRLPQQ